MVIPLVAVLITSILAAPQHWVKLIITTTVGSVIGTILFSILVRHYGIHFIEMVSPDLMKHAMWQSTEKWISEYGFGAVFGISALPITDHPMIVIASLAKMPLMPLSIAITLAKLTKYFFFGALAVYAPQKLLKIKPISKEIQEIGK